MNLDCLRGFPHVLARIRQLWGHPELEIYIKKLMLPDTTYKEGFPPKAFGELMKVADVHRLLYGKCDTGGYVATCCIEKR